MNQSKPALPDGVSVYVLHESGSGLLLSLRKNTATFPNHYQCPGGTVESGEGIRDAAVRELKEETGLIRLPGELNRVHPAVVHQKPDGSKYRLHTFSTSVRGSEIMRLLEPDKASDWVYRSWHECCRLPIMQLMPGTYDTMHFLARKYARSLDQNNHP